MVRPDVGARTTASAATLGKKRGQEDCPMKNYTTPSKHSHPGGTRLHGVAWRRCTGAHAGGAAEDRR